jgi:RNA polymerase sigma-70 factor, ECF subfamily
MATPDLVLTDALASLGDPTLAAGLEIVALRRLGDPDDARDAVQETLARAVAAGRDNRLPTAVPLSAFVYGIARHVIADAIRRRDKEGGSGRDPENLESPAASALESLIRAEDRFRLGHALGTLRASDRELLELCFVRGETVAEIARRRREPAERIRKRKSRALERLREELTAQGSMSEAAAPL